MSKNLKIFLGCALLTVFLLPAVVLADPNAAQKFGYGETANVAGLPKTLAGATTLGEAMGSLVGGLLSFVGVVFFGLILYAGITWMTARGDSAKVDKAKEVMEGAIIGILLVTAAYAIANFVFTMANSGSADAQCTAKNGVCLDNADTACDANTGTVQAGLCGGAATRKCCIPKVSS